MTNLTATFTTEDNNTQDGNINVWFDVTGTVDSEEDGEYALCVENGEVTSLLDCDGCPCNTDDNHIAVVFEACKEALTEKTSTTIAESILNKLNFSKTIIGSYDNNELDNNELHDLLNEECVYFQELCDQDTWSFSDGSYITRNVDDYFLGDDVTEFELTHSMIAAEA